MATDIDFYTMTTYYNGKKYRFDIYKDNVISTTERFNESGIENIREVLREGTDEHDEFAVYYEPTLELNGVIVEASVKRHKKQEYLTAIKNQLGYIDNIDLIMCDNDYPSYRYKQDFAIKVLHNENDIIVGEYDHYARPQVILRPGKNSKNLISYGKLSWEDLEMKEYAGNVCFVMDINDVDVTQSRESIRYTTRTREAVKAMILKSQKLIDKYIKDKVLSINDYFEYLYKFNEMKSPKSSGVLSELWKIVDTTEISPEFKGKKLGGQAINVSKELENKIIFTSTKVTSNNKEEYLVNYSGKYLNNITLSKLYTGSDEFKHRMVFYIGTIKYKNLAVYCVKQGLVQGEEIVIVYIQEDFFESMKDVEIDKKLKAAYKTKDKYITPEIVSLNVIKAALDPNAVLLFEEDIDKDVLTSAVKNKAISNNSRYSWGQVERAKGKTPYSKMQTTGYGHTCFDYLNDLEKKFAEKTTIILNKSDPSLMAFFRKLNFSYWSSNPFQIFSFTSENYKEVIKLKGAKPLVEALYKIKFGELEITPIGKTLLSNYSIQAIKDVLNGKSINENGMPRYFRDIIKSVANMNINKYDFKDDVDLSIRHKKNKVKDNKYAKNRALNTLRELKQESIINN